ncbi:MAG: HD-like signal output (HDOD) protein [Planctomycetota bacterium]|jgi:HD-like signal output (HDOD) protein
MDAEAIQKRLGGKMNMPSLQRHAELARLLLKQEDVSLPEVAALVRQDPPLTARLLRGVNSAAYSLNEPVFEPTHAASVMGVRGLQNLIMRAPTFDEKRVLAETGYDITGLWETSSATAALCVWMHSNLQAARRFEENELEIHGLLCDIGRYAMFDGLGNDFAIACKKAVDESRSLESVERETFGFSHNDLGAMLVKRWSLPESFVKTTRFHHNDQRVAEADPLVSLIYVAGEIVEHRIEKESDLHRKMGMRIDQLMRTVPHLIHERLELSTDFYEAALRYLTKRATESKAA